jgi:DNA-binding HxlR family transcriptional regulator
MRLADCPVRVCLDVIGGKWKPIILNYVMGGPKRFGQLRRLIPEATQRMLTKQLRELEQDGVLTRKVFPSLPLRVEYSFTPRGEALRPALIELCKWGQMRKRESPWDSSG